MVNLVARPWVCTSCAARFFRKRHYLPASNIIQRRRNYSSKPVTQNGKPFRMAVIGSGPAGFYTAYKVMSKIDNSVVDMYESLPVPFGLVRFGVAPDHPEVKNCQDKFDEVASSPRFNFIGNIAIGSQYGALPLQAIISHYDAILFAYGASKDKTLGLPGENDLKGIYSARAFVGWYNGLPEYADLAPNLTAGEDAVVIGQGNVALDVARILLQDPAVLKSTDITSNAVETLKKSRVKRVKIVGRRGPLQAPFTIKEIRELAKLPSVALHPVDESLIPADTKSLERPSRRIMEVLKKGSTLTTSQAPKSWSLDFCLSPTSFNVSRESPSQLASISFERTTLLPSPFDPQAQAVSAAEMVNVTTPLAFRSIGYKSEALPGFQKLGIPFDNRTGTIPNDHLGRIVTQVSGESRQAPGLYCAGWVKRGPTGVIASTMNDAFATAESIVEDWHSHAKFLHSFRGEASDGWDGVKQEAQERGCRRVSWEDWRAIDNAEKSNGKAIGKEREKFTKLDEMLAVLD